MKTLRELFNSYATPPTEEELRLLEKLDRQQAKPKAERPR